MNIGKAARLSGLSAKMIRHYESIGLIKPGLRSDSGYRLYDESDLHTLGFIKRSRSLGFSLEHIRELLSLWRDKNRSSAEVKRIALRHIAGLDEQIRELVEMRDALQEFALRCGGDHRPDCPILQGLSEQLNSEARLSSQRRSVRKEM